MRPLFSAEGLPGKREEGGGGGQKERTRVREGRWEEGERSSTQLYPSP